MEIRTRLAARNPEAHEPDLAAVLWNLAVLYDKQEEEEKLINTLRAARPLYDKLARIIPWRYGEKAKLIRSILEDM